MRALWSAASGMKAQQINIDTISNNLANVNTTGFKKQRVEFKDLLYEKLRLSNFNEGEGRPVNLEVGHGVMAGATLRNYGQGTLQRTDNSYDLAIVGDEFFEVVDERGKTYFTKDGAFKISAGDGTSKLVTSDGKFVQGDGGVLDLGENLKEVNIDKYGNVVVTRADDTKETIDRIKLQKFSNVAGLDSAGENLYEATDASGAALSPDDATRGQIKQGFLEGSNVQVVEEMVNLITAQRAYELNSKTIQTSDSMLELANNLKR